MNEILFTTLKLLVMLVVLIITRYFVPWIKTQIDAQKLETIAKWAKKAVLSAQQTLEAKASEDRKAVVTEFLKELLTAKNISLTDKQLDILIEAAVKEMKIEEGKSSKK